MRRKWIAASVAAVLLISGVTVPGAHAESNVRKQVKELRSKKKTLLDEIEATTEKERALKREMREIEEEVEKLKKENEPQIQRFLQYQEEAKKYEESFKRKLVQMYVQGETNYLVRLLEAPSFDQFLQRFEILRILTKRDHDTWTRYAEQVEKMKKEYGKVFANLEQQDKLMKEYHKKLDELLKEKAKTQKDLENLEHQLEMHEDVITQINLEEWRNGSLKFSYIGPLSYPSKSRMTSRFGSRDLNRDGKYEFHAGIDFGGPYGVPIYAAADGVVVGNEAVRGYGWLITIYHGHKNGVPLFTRYAHMEPGQVKVRLGQEVKRGDQIASVGNNGKSTGPHLHFEVRLGHGQNAVDPMNYLAR
ncbi:M23 family metallopeptidase [Staphylospora marina]|uniref:M23 family metallopeptidase n=1 Tax=Staphylospora marina TaxID=2490858 RepID=UPI000F5C0028|nr:M23 family metallopeptidase [Staphylospora marina]